MKLLQTEIDIEPGRQPQAPQREGAIGRGAATLRLTNTSKRENAYTIRIEGSPCANQRFWQKSWYRITSLPPNPAGPNNAPPAGRDDQRGNQDQWVKIFVKPEGTRDVQIRFVVPRKSESRAGIYPFKVQIETDIMDAGADTGRKERFIYLPAVAIVRPFHQWRVSLLPEAGRHVGRFRRRAAFEVQMSNEGNDWLYCDLKVPHPKDLRLETPVIRTAVRPPEPGEDAAIRRVPLTAITQLKLLRGDHTPQQIPLQILRVDAPSVPPLSVDADYQGVATASLGAAVVATTPVPPEMQQTPGDTVVTYCPPIPSTLTGFMGALTQNIKGLAIAVMGFILLLHMAVWFWQGVVKSVVAEPITASVQPGDLLTFKGIYLEGAKVVVTHNGTREPPLRMTQGKKQDVTNKKAVAALARFSQLDLQYWSIPIDKDWTNQTLTLEVHRASFIPYFSDLLKYACETKVTVDGPPPVLKPAPPQVFPLGEVPKHAGETVTVRGHNLGNKGRVQIDDRLISDSVVKWDTHGVEVQFVVPGGLSPDTHPIAIIPDGSDPLSAGAIKIPPPANSAGATAPGTQSPATPVAGGGQPATPSSGNGGKGSGGAPEGHQPVHGPTAKPPQPNSSNTQQPITTQPELAEPARSFVAAGDPAASKDYADIARIAETALQKGGGRAPSNFAAVSSSIEQHLQQFQQSGGRTLSILKTAQGLRIACTKLFKQQTTDSYRKSFEEAITLDDQNFLAYMWRARCIAAAYPLGSNPGDAADQLQKDIAGIKDPNVQRFLAPVHQQLVKMANP